jgi:hypothetical protein
MDREDAKFILRAFRPDGADAGDPDFAEALRLSAEDRELGEWLADERALDSEIARLMGALAVPADLQGKLLAIEHAEWGGIPQVQSELDSAMIGSFAAIQPPAALRGELILAMQRTASTGKKGFFPRRFLAWPLAAAAGIALAVVLFRQPGAVVSPIAATPEGTVPVEVVQASFIRTFESPFYTVDDNHGKHDVIDVLEKKKLPCPKRLPPGLAGCAGMACREMLIDGKRGSLVCFDEKENGRVHLVVFKRSDVCGDLPGREKPALSQNGPWAVARWMDDGYVYVLLGSSPLEKLGALF